MFQSYFISAIRHITRHKLYSIINIMGLAVGIAACLLISLFVRYETSYDNWLPNAENIYRVNYSLGDNFICGCVPGIVKGPIDQHFSEIEETTRFYLLNTTLAVGAETFKERVWLADPNFFNIFDLNFLDGDKNSAFDEFMTIVISERMAKKYFGDISPIGEVLTFNYHREARNHKIVGVFEDIPDNSEFDFDFIFPLDAGIWRNIPALDSSWYNVWGFLYINLKQGADPEGINSQLNDLVEQSLPPIDERETNEAIKLSLTNIQDIHLYSPPKQTGIKPLGSISKVYTFIVIGALILLIACTNFINLSTARSSQRAKEVGLRKTVGASRGQLIKQFLGESTVVALLALIIGFLLAGLALPYFNVLSGLTLDLNYLNHTTTIIIGLVLLILIGGGAGMYPAFYLSSFRPNEIQTRKGKSKNNNLNLRGALIVFQFSISISLIIVTSVVYSQNLYGLNKDLGYSKENKLVARRLHAKNLKSHLETLVQEIQKLPSVLDTSMSRTIPSDITSWANGFSIFGEEGAKTREMAGLSVDPNFFDLYQIPILSGRNFDQNREPDKSKIPLYRQEQPDKMSIINETAARQFGFYNVDDAVGKLLKSRTGNYRIIGVVSDFHSLSFREPFYPFVYTYTPEQFQSLTIAYIEGADIEQLQKDVTKIWKSLDPEAIMEFDFVEGQIAALYADDIKQSHLLLSFSILAIFVASLGLYGLAAFTAETRTKEIAIRKVHGAGVWDAIKELLVQFSKPVLLSNLIAWPIAWYFMSDYLNGFIFRIELGVMYFIGAGIIALIIAWATTLYHSIKVASTKPAEALRRQ